jgi:type III secretion protein V
VSPAPLRSPTDIAENLIAALQPEAVEIQVPREYLRETTLAEAQPDAFKLLRDGLFYELGARYPDFRFVEVENLRPCSFRFRLGHVSTFPRRGLRNDQLLANDTPDRLRLLNLQAEPALNPANSNGCAVVGAQHSETLRGANLTTWTPYGYIVLALAGELRKASYRFITRLSVEAELTSVGRAFPALTQAVCRTYTSSQITRTLRALMSEEISIRNLRAILELLLDWDYIVADSSKYIIFDDRFPFSKLPSDVWREDADNCAAHVRTGLKRQISTKYARGSNTMAVYLLDPKIDELLAAADPPSEQATEELRLDEADRERILQAVRDELASLSPGFAVPALLTSVNLRPLLRQILSGELPGLPVVAYQELSPDLNIQPIARIALQR